MRKHGWGKRRTWRKIRLGMDEKTGEITAQALTDNKTEDAEALVDLVADWTRAGCRPTIQGTVL